ncbi:MAG: mechanosensitive ion channel family protein [Elusimicrobiota bacterium]|jgi:small-conductance mechanosensitive channel|nr:mechanosensitive ion channel family protein [Elusimicrobiota bacterium]
MINLSFKRVFDSGLKVLISIFVISLLSLSAFSQNAPEKADLENQTTSSLSQNAQEKSDLKNQTAYKVAPFKEPLFYIYRDLGGISAKKRADIISENISDLAADPLYNPESLEIKEDPITKNQNIVYLDRIIVSIDAQDSSILKKDKEIVAKEYIDAIKSAVETARKGNMWYIIAKRLGLVILVLLLTYFIIKYVNKFYGKLKQNIWQRRENLPAVINKIIGAGQQMQIITGFLNILRSVFIVFIIIIDAMIFLWLFPETRSFANNIIGYILNPLKNFGHALWNYIPDLFAIIIISAIYLVSSKILKAAAHKIESGDIKIKSFYPDWAMSTYNIVRAILLIFTIIAAFPHLPNSNSEAFKGMSMFIGLLLSLGSTSIINNIVSGFVITYMRPFQIGDRIKMGENDGTVIEKTALVTRIRTPKNERITIPNSQIMATYTINYTNSAKNNGLILHREVALGYDVPWRKVHELLIEAALKTPEVLRDPAPFVLQSALDDFYARYQINVYTDNADMMQKIYTHLYENVQDILIRENIELSLPHLETNTIIHK